MNNIEKTINREIDILNKLSGFYKDKITFFTNVFAGKDILFSNLLNLTLENTLLTVLMTYYPGLSLQDAKRQISLVKNTFIQGMEENNHQEFISLLNMLVVLESNDELLETIDILEMADKNLDLNKVFDDVNCEYSRMQIELLHRFKLVEQESYFIETSADFINFMTFFHDFHQPDVIKSFLAVRAVTSYVKEQIRNRHSDELHLAYLLTTACEEPSVGEDYMRYFEGMTRLIRDCKSKKEQIIFEIKNLEIAKKKLTKILAKQGFITVQPAEIPSYQSVARDFLTSVFEHNKEIINTLDQEYCVLTKDNDYQCEISLLENGFDLSKIPLEDRLSMRHNIEPSVAMAMIDALKANNMLTSISGTNILKVLTAGKANNFRLINKCLQKEIIDAKYLNEFVCLLTDEALADRLLANIGHYKDAAVDLHGLKEKKGNPLLMSEEEVANCLRLSQVYDIKTEDGYLVLLASKEEFASVDFMLEAGLDKKEIAKMTTLSPKLALRFKVAEQMGIDIKEALPYLLTSSTLYGQNQPVEDYLFTDEDDFLTDTVKEILDNSQVHYNHDALRVVNSLDALIANNQLSKGKVLRNLSAIFDSNLDMISSTEIIGAMIYGSYFENAKVKKIEDEYRRGDYIVITKEIKG